MSVLTTVEQVTKLNTQAGLRTDDTLKFNYRQIAAVDSCLATTPTCNTPLYRPGGQLILIAVHKAKMRCHPAPSHVDPTGYFSSTPDLVHGQ